MPSPHLALAGEIDELIRRAELRVEQQRIAVELAREDRSAAREAKRQLTCELAKLSYLRAVLEQLAAEPPRPLH